MTLALLNGGKIDPDAKTSLYRHFNAEGVLLYVGISLSHAERLKAHQREAHWTDAIANVTIETFASRQAAREAEKKAIRIEGPLHNIQDAERIASRSRSNPQIELRMSPELLGWLEEIAKAEDRTVAYVIRRFLLAEMKKAKPHPAKPGPKRG